MKRGKLPRPYHPRPLMPPPEQPCKTDELKVSFKITNLDELKKEIEDAQRLITEVGKKINRIKNFKADVQLVKDG